MMDARTQTGDRLPAVTLWDVDGRPVELEELLDRPVAFPLVRYYGCMPCRAFLAQLEDARLQLEATGVRVIGVGGAADYQARHLMDHSIGYPLLLDPDHRLYDALDVRRIAWHTLLRPGTWWRYLRALRRARQGRITDHPLQAPGFAIVDTDRTVAFLYRGTTLGDYPPLDDILTAARAVAAHPAP
jgi:peroxiredoxin